jgi:hypothetical protein
MSCSTMPSSFMPSVFFFHCSAVRLRSSSTAPEAGSRYISGMTTTCLPPTAAVSLATSSICDHTASHELSWHSRSNTVAADSWRFRARQFVGQLLGVGRQIPEWPQLDPLITGFGHLVEEACVRELRLACPPPPDRTLAVHTNTRGTAPNVERCCHQPAYRSSAARVGISTADAHREYPRIAVLRLVQSR